MIFLLLLLGCFFSEIRTEDSNFTFTYAMASRCKEHICHDGYTYTTYYKLDSDTRKIVRSDPKIVLEMHLAIQAPSNGHILLSSTPAPEAQDNVYEIVVGGGGNKFTELRRNLRRNARTSAKTFNILSPIEFRAFYIKIDEDGLIEFGKEGESLPILTYLDKRPLEVRYFSFASWKGVEAKFLYDCPNPTVNGTGANSPDSQEVERKLSNSDALKRSLLLYRQPSIPPRPEMNVQIGLVIISVRYNAFDSKLTTKLAIVMSWIDDSMAWDPSKFNGTTRLTFREGQIWRPTFFVVNSDTSGPLGSKNTDQISMVNSGEATFHFQTTVRSYCTDDPDNYNGWPRDKYSCTIIMAAWDAHEKITIETIPDDKMTMYTDLGEAIANEWEVTGSLDVIPLEKWKKVLNLSDNDTNQSDKITIGLELQRKATTYNIVFYTPLLVLVTFILMSFWTEPLKDNRLWTYTCCTVLICMGLCYIDYLVPCHNIPSILVLYVTILFGVLLALHVHVALMTSTAEKLCKTVTIQSLLISKPFRTLFCLPIITTCRNYESINEAYVTQEDLDSGVGEPSRNGSFEEMQAENSSYGEREELAEALDKFMFVLYSVVFAVMLACHF